MKGGKKLALSACAAETAGSGILTERTRMRRHTVSDFKPSAALWSDPDVVRFIAAKNGFVERCSGELRGSPVLIMERLNSVNRKN
ncbi:hypothetical protein SAMN05877838_2159 [Hoeflea halophila]|uniref:Uncharacterized protein n=1 Tax=Hoeflea halophila TaxID=714899 RepID=A0A286IB16_9HYPH|nr:hypothetical protein [Hoeflea halophila]SOE17261.1 hypothetical protein SAMN05877838_2159 [Hoeflea halophila]